MRGAHRFAFVLHPLTVDYLANHPRYAWTRHLPRRVVEATAAYMPAQAVGRVTGGRSPATGQAIEGLIYALGSTPREMLTHSPEFTYARIVAAVRAAADRGAQIVGLGAFTKVVGDAGITIAKRSPIPVTTGNSLTPRLARPRAWQGDDRRCDGLDRLGDRPAAGLGGG